LTLWDSKRKYEKQAHPAAHIKLLKNSRKNREKVPVAAAQIMRAANATLAHSHIRAGGESLSPFFCFSSTGRGCPGRSGPVEILEKQAKKAIMPLHLSKPSKTSKKLSLLLHYYVGDLTGARGARVYRPRIAGRNFGKASEKDDHPAALI